jgi:hypothetical protein
MEAFPQENMLSNTRKKEGIGEMQKTRLGQLVRILFSVESDMVYDAKVDLYGENPIAILIFL